MHGECKLAGCGVAHTGRDTVRAVRGLGDDDLKILNVVFVCSGSQQTTSLVV